MNLSASNAVPQAFPRQKLVPVESAANLGQIGNLWKKTPAAFKIWAAAISDFVELFPVSVLRTSYFRRNVCDFEWKYQPQSVGLTSLTHHSMRQDQDFPENFHKKNFWALMKGGGG